MNTYHIAVADQVSGPYTITQIRNMWRSGSITADAQVCKSGTEFWVPIHTLVTPSLKASGHMTKLGMIGVVMFGVMALPALLAGALIAGVPLLLLSALCYLKARSDDAPQTPLRSIVLMLVAGLGIIIAGAAYWWRLSQDDLQAERYMQQQRAKEINAEIERTSQAFWREVNDEK